MAGSGSGDEGLEKSLCLGNGISFGELARSGFGAALFQEDNGAGGKGMVEEAQRRIEDHDARRPQRFQ
jgi:hypothetical protein